MKQFRSHEAAKKELIASGLKSMSFIDKDGFKVTIEKPNETTIQTKRGLPRIV